MTPIEIANLSAHQYMTREKAEQLINDWLKRGDAEVPTLVAPPLGLFMLLGYPVKVLHVTYAPPISGYRTYILCEYTLPGGRKIQGVWERQTLREHKRFVRKWRAEEYGS